MTTAKITFLLSAPLWSSLVCAASHYAADGFCDETEQASLLQSRMVKEGAEGGRLVVVDTASTDPTCPVETGKTCYITSCMGGSVCQQGKCVCQPGSCAFAGSCHSPTANLCLARSASPASGKMTRSDMEKSIEQVLGKKTPPKTSPAEVGLKAWVSQNGLDFVAEKVVSFIDKSIRQAEIPSFNGTGTAGFFYKISQIKFSIGATPTIELIEDLGLRLKIKALRVHLSADLFAELGPLWTQGEISALSDVETTSLDVSIAIAAGSDGLPQVWITGVDASVGTDYVRYSGSLLSGITELTYWLFSTCLDKLISDLLKDALATVVCDGIADAMTEVDLVQPIPLPAPFDIAAIDLGVMSVVPGADSLAVGLSGAIKLLDGTTVAGYAGQPSQLPTVQLNNDKYVSAAASEWVANSLFHVFQEKGLLKMKVTNQDLPADSPVKLVGSTFALLIPRLALLHSRSELTVDIRTKSAPIATVEDGYVKAACSIELDFNLVNADGSETKAFSLASGLDIAVKTWFEQPEWPAEGRTAAGTCEKKTGGTCSWSPCDGSRGAFCRYGDCVCPSDMCAVNGKCVPEPPTPPTAAPRPTQPPEVVKWHFQQLDMEDITVLFSDHGLVSVACLNWVKEKFMPAVLALINAAGCFSKGIPLDTTGSPITPRRTIGTFQENAIRLFSDFSLSDSDATWGKFLVDMISEEITDLLVDALEEETR